MVKQAFLNQAFTQVVSVLVGEVCPMHQQVVGFRRDQNLIVRIDNVVRRGWPGPVVDLGAQGTRSGDVGFLP